MRRLAFTNRGSALVTVMVCVALMAVVLASMTVRLVSVKHASALHVRSIQSRALAEGGLEAAFARLGASAALPEEDLVFELDGGECRVTISADPASSTRVRVVSVGRRPSGRVFVVSRVAVVLDFPQANRKLVPAVFRAVYFIVSRRSIVVDDRQPRGLRMDYR